MHCKYINWQKGKRDDVFPIGMTDVLSTAFSHGLRQFGHPSPLFLFPPPSSIFFSYLLKIPAFPDVKFHFLTALPSFYIFVCRNPWHTCTDSWKSNHRTSGFHWPMNTLMVMNMFHRKRNGKAQHPHSSINLYIKLSSQAKMLTFSSRCC